MSPKQKIAPNCNFFAIRDRREFPRSKIKARKRSKMAILRLFSALRERGGVPNRKKVAKTSGFLFLQWEDRHDRARLNTLFAYSEISPRRRESFAPGNATKNRPKAVSFSEIWLGQQDSNLHNWYQKPGSCHWTMAQRMP